MSQARHVIIRATQEEVFAKELTALELGQAVTKASSLQKLRLVLEDDLICYLVRTVTFLCCWCDSTMKMSSIKAIALLLQELPSCAH